MTPLRKTRFILLSLASVGLSSVAHADSFYKDPQGLFSTRPSEKASVKTVARFGPVGMGIDLVQPAFTMKIHNIEEGSPAAAAGTLKAGQFIQSINGQKLSEIDPRIQLGGILAAAEAGDGMLRFQVSDQAQGPAREVVVQIPVLGAYGKSWPLSCPKSEKIVRGFADYVAQPGANQGFGGIGMLVLLGTGEEKDLAVVRDWARGLKTTTRYAWHLGYGGIPLTEYYLRTGDEAVLPIIQGWVNSAAEGQYFGGWAGRGGVAGVTYGGGGGHLNAGGTAVVTFLLLAKECGVDVPDQTLHSALTHFFRFAGRGSNPYGNNRPEEGFVDNGKNGNLAFAMAAAAALTPDGEQSVYAGARDAAALTSFYTTSFMLHGHTGGGIGEIWRSAAMGLLHEKFPHHYREFMDNRQWHYDLSRRWDGSFGILGGARYDNVEWGAGLALAYIVPRKTLRITGASPSKFSKAFQLPERPWGTEEDDEFASIARAGEKTEARPDFLNETLVVDSGRPMLARLVQPKVSDETLQRYIEHPDYLLRLIAARKAAGLNSSYIRKPSPSGEPMREALLDQWMRSPDARIRRAAVQAVGDALSGQSLLDFLKPEGVKLVYEKLADPKESWWVKQALLKIVSQFPGDAVVPQVDLVMGFLQHQEWWLQSAALEALAPVVTDPRCYQKVLPAIGELLRTNQRYNVTAGPMYKLRSILNGAGPEVRKLAAETLKAAYFGFDGVTEAPGGQDITTTYNSQLDFLASSLAGVPGGYDLLYEVAKKRFPETPLPYAKLFLGADPEEFGPELRKDIEPIIRDQLIYEYIGKNRRRLLPEAEGAKQNSFVTGSLDDLTALYRKVGVRDYDWRPFGGDRDKMEWRYLTFDPKEKMAFDVGPWRYREVSYPAGMENWFTPEFDAAKAGWKKGRGPFGQYKGRLVTDSKPCSNSSCRHSDPMHTLWDKEVLLIRGTFKFPPLKPGHLYRIRVGTGQHVGSGDGYKIYLNGRELIETTAGVGRRAGARPRGAYITKDFVEEFKKGPVTVAATSFLRYGDKAIVQTPPVPQGTFSLWLEEMKLPPLGAETVRKSATVIPMLSSEWQSKQDPDNAELKGEDDRFRFDGNFQPNTAVLGSWNTVSVVSSLEEFDPAKPVNAKRAPMKWISFKEGGATSSETVIWSGDMLMDLDRFQALKMTLKKVAGADYLVVEAGGFSEKNPRDWKSPLVIMKRVAQGN